MITISQEFLQAGDTLYFNALLGSYNSNLHVGINVFEAPNLSSCYILYIASLEALLNELFLNPFVRSKYPDYLDKIENKSVEEKLKYVCKRITSNKVSFSYDSHPFKDLKQLIKVRHSLTHFKGDSIDKETEEVIEYLRSKKIFINKKIMGHPFCCTEGVRWAHNTVTEIVSLLSDWIRNSKEDCWDLMQGVLSNYKFITEETVRNLLLENDIVLSDNVVIGA